MKELTDQQKSYIKKNLYKLSIDDLSAQLNTEKKQIAEYISKKYGQKGEKFLIKTSKPFEVKIRYVVILIIGLIFLVYLNSFNNNFVSDDIASIVQNPQIGDFNYVLAHPPGMLRRFLYFLAFQMAGLSPFIFRSINIIFHTGTAILVFLILKRLHGNLLAIITAILFAVHPLLSEAVIWISGGAYVQSAFFFLLAFYFYFQGGKRNFIFSAVSYFLSLQSQLVALVFIPTIFLYEYFYGNLKKNIFRLGLYLLLSPLQIYTYLSDISERSATLQTVHYQQTGVDNPLVLIPVALSSYLELILWPIPLTLYHSEMALSPLQFLLKIILLLLFLLCCYLIFKRDKRFLFWALFFVISLLPTIIPAIFRMTWIVAERYVYLASLGVFVLIAYLIQKLLKISPTTISAVVLIVMFLVIRTFFRNNDWQSEDSLWFATAQYSPSSPNIHNNLGDVYGRMGNHQQSLLEFQKAVALKPNYADAYHNMGNAYRSLGDKESALKAFKQAYELSPTLWQSYQNSAAIYFEEGKVTEAIDVISLGLKNNPDNLNLKNILGIILLNSGQKSQAIKVFEEVLSIDPQNLTAKQGLTLSQ